MLILLYGQDASVALDTDAAVHSGVDRHCWPHSGSANTDAAAYEAPSDISKGNGTLAEALGVKRTPTLQVPLCSPLPPFFLL